MEIPHPPDAGRDGYHSLGSSPRDLDDELWNIGPGDFKTYRELRLECKEPLDPKKCRAFGVSQWNLTSHFVLGLENRGNSGKRLCEEDHAVLEKMQDVRQDRCDAETVVCRKIGDKVRLVGLRVSLSRRDAELLVRLPHLFSLLLEGVHEDLSEVALPESLRMLTLRTVDLEAEVPRLAPLLRRHARLWSLGLQSSPNLKQWPRLDLSHFCGLRSLRRFHAWSANVGHIPACWGGRQGMTRLEAFNCRGCMMTSPPTALRNVRSLRSFVAFRQSEMIPCLAKELEDEIGPCKPSWETVMKLKVMGRDVSEGTYGDFKNGPSYLCEKQAYAFPFREFLSLGWAHIEKLWLDGNFLTGEIPQDIHKVWPHLQSLDLYENNMSGEIPESLVGLDLVKLQLNGNDFNGTLPKGLGQRLRDSEDEQAPLHLGVAGNPRLEGCLPSEYGIAQTRLRTCGHDEL